MLAYILTLTHTLVWVNPCSSLFLLMTNTVSAACWVRKGAAKPIPEKFKLTEEQYQELMQRAEAELTEARQKLKEKEGEGKDEKSVKKRKKGEKSEKKTMKESNASDDDNETMAKFKMDEYDDEPDGLATIDDAIDLFTKCTLTQKDELADSDAQDEEEEEDEEDVDDLTLRQTDSVLLSCRTEDGLSYLEVQVYEEGEDNLYVHHDLMLPTYPLCVEWIGNNAGEVGNFAAVGTFDPQIEVWNLDVLEVPFPTLTLGEKPSKKGKTSQKTIGHKDAVMSLSWNKQHCNMLISGGADNAVCLWDLNEAIGLRSFQTIHTDKVQTIEWHPTLGASVASAAYDRLVKMWDVRSNEQCLLLNLSNDPEQLAWHPTREHQLAVADEGGMVHLLDTRQPGQCILQLQAHSKSCTSLDWNPVLPDCLLTASLDKSWRIWNLKNQPTAIISREPGIGKIFTASWAPDAPGLVAVGGSRGEMRVTNVGKLDIFHQTFLMQ